MDSIDGMTAFITGGARGIGLGIARTFAQDGAKLALVDIDEAALKAARTELGKQTSVETFVLDVRDRAAYARVADEAEARLGPVSILCNNAGVAGAVGVTHMTYPHWDWVIGINLNGVINGVQTFVPRMFERKTAAHIVNTASGAGLIAEGSGILYNTSKFAVVGLSEALRRELKPFGIGVSVLCPGPVATSILQNTLAFPGRPQAALTPEEVEMGEKTIKLFTEYLSKGVPPDEVGRMVLAAVKANQRYILTDRIVEDRIKARTKAILDAMPASSCGTRRSRPEHRAQAGADYLLSLGDHPRYDLARRQDRIDQTGILADQNRRMICITRKTRGFHFSGSRMRFLPKLPLPSSPRLNETIAQGPRHSTRPNATSDNIGNLRQHGVVPIAVDDGLFEVSMQRRLVCGEEAGTEQDTVRA